MGLNIQWYTLMIDENEAKDPATPEGVKLWKDTYGLEHPSVLADPSIAMLPPGSGSFGTPMFTVVDPRTMTVVHLQEGAGGHNEKILELAEKNKAAAEAGEPEI